MASFGAPKLMEYPKHKILAFRPQQMKHMATRNSTAGLGTIRVDRKRLIKESRAILSRQALVAGLGNNADVDWRAAQPSLPRRPSLLT